MRKNPTRDEVAFRTILRDLKIPYEMQICIGAYIADFRIRGSNLLFEIDGISHQSPKAMEYDAFRDRDLASMGYRVIRIKSEQIEDVTAVKQKITEVVNAACVA
jgi:very-short-patch-repair endonuclease